MSQRCGVVEYLCSAYPRIAVFHLLLWFGFALNTLTYFAVGLETAERTIVLLNYAGLFVFLADTGAMLVACRDYQEQPY